MQASNVSAGLTTAINALVTSGDLAAPRDIVMLVRDLAAVCSAADLEARQHAADVAKNNQIAFEINPRSNPQFNE
jgi:hypothetical protein